MPNDSPSFDGRPGRGLWKKLALLGILLTVAIIIYFQFRSVLTLDALAKQENHLRELQRQHPTVAYGVAFLIYVTVTGLSLPGAAVLTLAYGWFFGLLRGVILVSFASTTGATLAFLVSRYLFRDVVQRRFGDRLVRFNNSLERYGAYFLFTLRLIPAVPFFVINLVMGLTPIGTWTFWWVSQLGMLPGTAVYVYAGSTVPSIQTLASNGIGAVFSGRQLFQLAIAFGLLGLFPLLVRAALSYFGFAAPTPSGQSRPGENAE
jgi:uncharacterized membrane protein YdjX (TVP38/TMEM64 family)